MNLQEQGFRFVWRPERRECFWCHPAEVKPSDLDCTDMSDRDFELFIGQQITGRPMP